LNKPNFFNAKYSKCKANAKYSKRKKPALKEQAFLLTLKTKQLMNECKYTKLLPINKCKQANILQAYKVYILIGFGKTSYYFFSK
jgi:hypothetical protein